MVCLREVRNRFTRLTAATCMLKVNYPDSTDITLMGDFQIIHADAPPNSPPRVVVMQNFLQPLARHVGINRRR